MRVGSTSSRSSVCERPPTSAVSHFPATGSTGGNHQSHPVQLARATMPAPPTVVTISARLRAPACFRPLSLSHTYPKMTTGRPECHNRYTLKLTWQLTPNSAVGEKKCPGMSRRAQRQWRLKTDTARQRPDLPRAGDRELRQKQGCGGEVGDGDNRIERKNPLPPTPHEFSNMKKNFLTDTAA
jgi:hypothetical protein